MNENLDRVRKPVVSRGFAITLKYFLLGKVIENRRSENLPLDGWRQEYEILLSYYGNKSASLEEEPVDLHEYAVNTNIGNFIPAYDIPNSSIN